MRAGNGGRDESQSQQAGHPNGSWGVLAATLVLAGGFVPCGWMDQPEASTIGVADITFEQSYLWADIDPDIAGRLFDIDGAGNMAWIGAKVGQEDTCARVAMLDADYNVVWTHDRPAPDGTTYKTAASAVGIDSGGNTWAAGRLDNGQTHEWYMYKLDTDGKLVWSERLDTTQSGANQWGPMGVDFDSGGNAIYAGCRAIDGSGRYGHIVKYDPEGNQIWAIDDTIDTDPGDDRVASQFWELTVDSDDNIIVTGLSENFAQRSENLLTAKFDRDGNMLWDRWYDQDNQRDRGESVAVDSGDRVFVTGWSQLDGTDWGVSMAYGVDGTELWTDRIYEGFSQSYGLTIATDGHDRAIVGCQPWVGGEATGGFAVYDTDGRMFFKSEFEGRPPTSCGWRIGTYGSGLYTPYTYRFTGDANEGILRYDIKNVPEPDVLSALALGLGALYVMFRRR